MGSKVLNNQRGISLIEVLVASVIFMIGFSILVMLLNGVTGRFDAKEIETAAALADDFMNLAVAEKDTLPQDTMFVASGIRYRVLKSCVVEKGIVKLEIVVKRFSSDKELVRLHNAFLTAT